MSYGYLSQMLEYLTGAYARSDIRNSRHSLPMETNIGRLFGTLAWGLEIIHKNADRDVYKRQQKGQAKPEYVGPHLHRRRPVLCRLQGHGPG